MTNKRLMKLNCTNNHKKTNIMNETKIVLGTSKQYLSDFDEWLSPIFFVDGAESVVIQTICSDKNTGNPQYQVLGSLDGSNFGLLTDSEGEPIEVVMNEVARIATIRGSNVKAIRIVGSADGNLAEVTLDEIIVRWK